MRTHHRNIRYRPPPRVEDRTVRAGFGLYLQFMRTYLLPHRWSVTICLFLVALNACSVYLMSFYARIVVDDILVVQSTPAAAPTAKMDQRIWRPERDGAPAHLPREGMGRRIDQGLSHTARAPGAGRRLLLLFSIYVTTQIVLNALARIAQRTQIRVAQDVTGQLRDDMHHKVLELSLAYHKGHTPGRLMARILSDVEMVQQQMLSSILSVASSLAMIVVGAAILLTADIRMFLIALAATPLYAAVFRVIQPRLRAISRELRHTNSCLYGLVAQKLDSMKAIQAYGREPRERLNFHRLSACFLRDALCQQRLGAAMSRWATIVSGLGTGIIFLLGAKLQLHGSMSMGKMMFVYGTTANLFSPVLQLTQIGVTYSSLLIILQRVADVLHHPVEIADHPDARAFPVPLRHGIRLEHVSFAYEIRQESTPVLTDICLDIPAGTWLCIMGASGCGKTTLLGLLARLHEPASGQVLVDGIPLNRIRGESLRRHVGFVPQEAQIFSGTVRDNICYGVPDALPGDIMAAAQAADLHDFILQMPVQYETIIGEKGASLSGGQRQRLSLARALLTRPDILILDDCTSALDANTERRIQNTLAKVLTGKTAVIVSQRVSMAKRCHAICVLENGAVAEMGTHAELLANKGFYARLHAQQTT